MLPWQTKSILITFKSPCNTVFSTRLSLGVLSPFSSGPCCLIFSRSLSKRLPDKKSRSTIHLLIYHSRVPFPIYYFGRINPVFDGYHNIQECREPLSLNQDLNAILESPCAQKPADAISYSRCGNMINRFRRCCAYEICTITIRGSLISQNMGSPARQAERGADECANKTGYTYLPSTT